MGSLGLIPLTIDLLNDFAKHEGCIIGVCDAAPVVLDATRFIPFVSRDNVKRSDPAASLPGAKSIVVVGVQPKVGDFPTMPEGAGILSVLGATEDYHIVVKALLTRLVEELQVHTNFRYKILVDSPTLDERALAVRAGLGFLGRNGLVISPEYGSRFNIGLLLTDIDILSLGKPQNVGCPSSCLSCINACPTGALSESDSSDASRCISYLTQKDNLTQEEAILMGNHLYGCDLCQDVCPFNHPQPKAWANPGDWLSMSDDDFTNTYGHTAMLWRGTALLRRNAKLTIENKSYKTNSIAP